MRREAALVRRAMDSWRANPAIEILGDLDADRLPIVSFVVHTPGGRRLHHNFVVALLNDLFGIQARGGCSCAGPLGHRLLGIGPDLARAFAAEAVGGRLGIKPGWTRLSFAFYTSDAVAGYIVAAVHLVATHGARLLPEYRFDPASGVWRHRAAPPLDPGLHGGLDGAMRRAREILASRPPAPCDLAPTGPAGAFERLRWFELPAACVAPAPVPER